MTQEHLKSLVTIQDLFNLKKELSEFIRSLFQQQSKKEFYTPKEFCELSGLKYATVVHHCHSGKLAAVQLTPKGCWIIDRAEVDRIHELAHANITHPKRLRGAYE